MPLNEKLERLNKTVAAVTAGKIAESMVVCKAMSCRSQMLIAEVIAVIDIKSAFDVYGEDVSDEALVRHRIRGSIRDVRNKLNDILEES